MFVVNVPIHDNGLSHVRSWLVTLTISIGKLIQYHKASKPRTLLVQTEEEKRLQQQTIHHHPATAMKSQILHVPPLLHQKEIDKNLWTRLLPKIMVVCHLLYRIVNFQGKTVRNITQTIITKMVFLSRVGGFLLWLQGSK
jgi:hypothetical protein